MQYGTYTMNYEKSTSLNLFVFTFQKNEQEPTQTITPAPDQILNRLRLQLKNHGSDRLRLHNTDNNSSFVYLGRMLIILLCYIRNTFFLFPLSQPQRCGGDWRGGVGGLAGGGEASSTCSFASKINSYSYLNRLVGWGVGSSAPYI